MEHFINGRRLTGLLAALVLTATPGLALVRFNDGRDQIYVTGTVEYGYNSNIFARQGGQGDSTTTTSLLVEYTRRAGYIGVNSSIGWDFGRFSKFTSENFADPHMAVELTKDIGRTTGSLTLNAARQSSADAAANVRTVSWSYNAGLNWKYPVIERYTLSGGFAYGLLEYIGNGSLTNLTTYTANVDMFYVYNNERDLLGGYRLRLSDTTASTKDVDQSISVGVSGRVIDKINGSVRVGWQIRQSTTVGGPNETFQALTASADTSWDITKHAKLLGHLGKDFTTTATNISTDSLTAGIQGQYAHDARLSFVAGVGYGLNKFLGPLGGGRQDQSLSWNAGVNYSYNDHFKVSLNYDYFINWSTLAASSFARHGVNVTVSSRW